jgi:predicted Rossmann fold nucleotide-binding protein DprA/Smf involved in DNA uptake
MKVAIVGSRNLTNIALDRYINDEAEEIVSGGAVGVDLCAAKYAKSKGLRLTEFLPQYESYGRGAPIVRNKQIVDYADEIVVFWDGHSRGTMSVIEYARKIGKPLEVILCE